jgi:hypothetical protein
MLCEMLEWSKIKGLKPHNTVAGELIVLGNESLRTIALNSHSKVKESRSEIYESGPVPNTVALKERTLVHVTPNDTCQPAQKFDISWRHFLSDLGFRPPKTPFLKFFCTYDKCTRKKTDLSFVFRIPPLFCCVCREQATI